MRNSLRARTPSPTNKSTNNQRSRYRKICGWMRNLRSSWRRNSQKTNRSRIHSHSFSFSQNPRPMSMRKKSPAEGFSRKVGNNKWSAKRKRKATTNSHQGGDRKSQHRRRAAPGRNGGGRNTKETGAAPAQNINKTVSLWR